MFKTTCPVCKSKIPDKATASLDWKCECPECKSKLKVSTSYKLLYFLSLFIGTYIGIAINGLFKTSDTNVLKFDIYPIVMGICVATVSFLFILLYPYKLTPISSENA